VQINDNQALSEAGRGQSGFIATVRKLQGTACRTLTPNRVFADFPQLFLPG
jgi:hypothetical protein